jgi:hypothetical protein
MVVKTSEGSYTAMNLYTFTLRTMAASESIEKRFETILEKINSIIYTLDDLLEDPIFLDTIHGEEELSLDLTLEVLDGIASKFEPQVQVKPQFPLVEDDSFDVD